MATITVLRDEAVNQPDTEINFDKDIFRYHIEIICVNLRYSENQD